MVRIFSLVVLALWACDDPPEATTSTTPVDTATSVSTTTTTTTTTTGTTTETTGTTPTDRTSTYVVIVGIDGAGGHFFDGPQTPNIDALVDQGLSTFEMQNVLPTSSSTNWMSMIGGTSPDQHGVLSNGWSPGDSSPPPTLFATLRDQRPDAVMGVFHDWADFGRLVEEGVADTVTHPGDEQQTMDAAIAWMATEQPELLFIHLDHVDHAGHLTTWGSANYNTAMEEADALVGQLVQALQSAGVWEETTLIISSDHGGENFSHGGDTHDERSIPFVMTAPWITEAATIDREVRIWDIAATAAKALGIQPDPAWVGRAVPEAWDGLPAGPAAAIPLAATTDWTWLFDDAGSGALADMSVWRPVVPTGFVLLGDAAMGSHNAPLVGSLAVESTADGVVPPIAYEEMWNTVGSGANNDVALWSPVPEPGYVCLGTVASANPGAPPPLDLTACVHQDVLIQADPIKLWDDTLSGAAWDAGLWGCQPNAAVADLPWTFQTRRDHDDPGSNRCWGFDPLEISGL